MSDRQRRRGYLRRPRRGSLLVEISVAAALLGSLLVIINQMAVRVHRQTAITEQHYIAQQTLQNLLEQITAEDFQTVSTESVDSLSLSLLAQAKLPAGRITGEVVFEEKPIPAKRLTLHLHWLRVADAEFSTSLTTWVYQPLEAEQ